MKEGGARKLLHALADVLRTLLMMLLKFLARMLEKLLQLLLQIIGSILGWTQAENIIKTYHLCSVTAVGSDRMCSKDRM